MTDPRSDVASAITGASLCWRCIALKAGLTAAQLDETLMAVRQGITVTMSHAPCDSCQRETLL